MQPQTSNFERSTSTSKDEEAEVAAVLSSFEESVRHGDLDAIMSFYADDLVAFDMMPPLRFTDKVSYQRTAWQECFIDVLKFPVNYRSYERQIIISGDVAFTHGIVEVSGTFKDGNTMEARLRNTTCLRKIGGRWMISHEHTSVPLALESGVGLMNLRPDEVFSH